MEGKKKKRREKKKKKKELSTEFEPGSIEGISADTLTIAKAYRADTLKGPGENTAI